MRVHRILYIVFISLFSLPIVAQTVPNITSISPTVGPVSPTGGSVTVRGSGFGGSQGSSAVTFAGIAGAPTSWNDTRIVVPVPSALPAGFADVSVTVNGTSSNTQSFLVIPTVLHASPLEGIVGTPITLTGTSFGDLQGTSTVTFHGVLATPTSWSNTSITVPVPLGANGAGTGFIVVTVNGFAAGGNFDVLPNIASLSQTGASVGSQVTISGSAFGPTPGFGGVTFNGVSATVQSWSDTSISVVVPDGATTGNLVVTTASLLSSNAVSFTIPSLQSLTVTPAIAGTTVGGTAQFTAIGTYTDGSTRDVTTSVTWSSAATSVATINANGLATGIASGNALIVATHGNITAFEQLTVTASTTLPGITAVVSPSPNGAGWTNLNATVTFNCTAGSASIVTCPGPQTVSTDGIGQVFSGTVVDAAGNSATASVTLNVDRTKPALIVNSPADRAAFSTASLTVTGTASDTLSGLDSVACNGLPATLSGAGFSCDISLSPGLNLLVVKATDLAGNVSASIMHLSLTTPFPAPQSLEITPGNVNMLVGDVQQFTAVDQLGRPRTDVTWTVSDNSSATITTDSSPNLIAIAVGQVTLTASVGSVSAQVQVNILFGDSLPVGTSRWSIPNSEGFNPGLFIPAEPTDGAPDLYAVETNASGDLNVKALTGDGQLIWSTQLPSWLEGNFVAAGDNNGGLLLSTGGKMFDLDAQTGTTLWSYGLTDLTINNPTSPAFSTDGTLYFWQQEQANNATQQAYLTALDGITGSPVARYPIPVGTITSSDGTVTPNSTPSVTDPVIDSNGKVWAAYAVIKSTLQSFTETLSLLEVPPGGGASAFTVNTLTGDPRHGPFAGPWQVIPNGLDGALVSWQATTFNPFGVVYHVSNVSSDGSSATFTFPSWMNRMVLGENGIAYADNPGGVTAFDLSNGIPLWTYSQPLSIVAALDGGGLLVNTDSGLVTLDSSGAVVASSGAFVGSPTPQAIDDWAGILNNSFGEFSGLTTSFAINEYSFPAGDPQGQHRRGTPVPTSLRVVSSNIVAPTFFDSPCDPLIEFQIAIGTRYQTLDQYQEPFTRRLMIPQEKLLANITDGMFFGDADPDWVDIGPTKFTGTSRFADANGQFIDAPFGQCASIDFDTTETQEISILVDGKNHLVRTSKWHMIVGPLRHGIITNGTDITKTF